MSAFVANWRWLSELIAEETHLTRMGNMPRWIALSILERVYGQARFAEQMARP